ncbi:hypothetical protein SAMN05216327_12242 [Dyadobacter sp. SG02]|uniref:hypothetical protein n=1 Tax=Dyadobacter sp. SG02 TaxID=1855291 RepID=UPI0008C03E34|nr:hypothetical protein [Dyadobacter sp. SG02]SEJ82774.1 hypothetical protein SAMN05216327_12242 [Dyadobacter sp. SG02]
MKFPLLKIIILSVLICCALMRAEAQDKDKSELSIGAGIMSSEDAATDLVLLWGSAVFNSHQEVRVTRASWSISYKYHVSERFAIGGSSVYNPMPDRWIQDFDFRNDDDWKVRSLTTAGEATLFWVKGKDFQFYGMIGAGFFAKRRTLYDTQVETNWGTTFQATPVGLRMGKKLGVFMELGYGYKGVFNGGMSMRF